MKFISIKRIHKSYEYLYIIEIKQLKEINYDPTSKILEIYLIDRKYQGFCPYFDLGEFNLFCKLQRSCFNFSLYESPKLYEKEFSQFSPSSTKTT
jgi:hypothetical protein